jgi:hypothetical protein
MMDMLCLLIWRPHLVHPGGRNSTSPWEPLTPSEAYGSSTAIQGHVACRMALDGRHLLRLALAPRPWHTHPGERVPQHARGTQTRDTMATPDHLSLYPASPVSLTESSPFIYLCR